MSEHARDPTGNDLSVGTYWPDHFAEMTWQRCIVEGCTTRLDPWLHKTRCPAHQVLEDQRRERIRAIVQANREVGRKMADA